MVLLEQTVLLAPAALIRNATSSRDWLPVHINPADSKGLPAFASSFGIRRRRPDSAVPTQSKLEPLTAARGASDIIRGKRLAKGQLLSVERGDMPHYSRPFEPMCGLIAPTYGARVLQATADQVPLNPEGKHMPRSPPALFQGSFNGSRAAPPLTTPSSSTPCSSGNAFASPTYRNFARVRSRPATGVARKKCYPPSAVTVLAARSTGSPYRAGRVSERESARKLLNLPPVCAARWANEFSYGNWSPPPPSVPGNHDLFIEGMAKDSAIEQLRGLLSGHDLVGSMTFNM